MTIHCDDFLILEGDFHSHEGGEVGGCLVER